jgi:hypothetical protein
MPVVHLYCKLSGSDRWELMRNDCDFLFTHLKGVEDYCPADGQGDMVAAPSVAVILARYQTTNYVYLLLKQ